MCLEEMYSMKFLIKFFKMMSGFKKMPKEKVEGSEGNRVKRV